ncbi:esterase/lipase family protein [Streptomyces monticola]|uniref:Esterase/lipase family protein n=1 Tax=Streptomyces monticola TaxID=2666263 RepID=A0ABW2JLI4_9ACTN
MPESEPNEQQISAALKADKPIVIAPFPGETPSQIPPSPHDVWDLPGGTAWVYYGEGNHALTRPVILADGFNTGPSDINLSWEYLDWRDYAFLSQLRARGRDVIILGFRERSASILENAEAAQAAIMRACAERVGDHRLAVGGFSMGGLVTRYALARLETQRMDHQTGLYFSYDSPHRGAWIPIALQAFAHYIRALDPRFSAQINSPASRQLLCQHITEWGDQHEVSKERTEFLAELARVGDWPRIPRIIGVANGMGDGQSNGIDAGTVAVQGKGLSVTGTKLLAQPEGAGQQLAAQLRVITLQKPEIHTTGLPAMDSAPGGTLEGFGILADSLNKYLLLGLGTEAPVRRHCFVPTVSAVAIRDVDTHENLYADINSLSPEESELDEFMVATTGNEEHTKMTEELCTWIMDRLP